MTGDFTGDGIPDLVVPGSGILSVPSLNVLPGKGDGTFITPIASPGGSNAAVAGDFNNDRKLDYAGLQGNNTVGIFLGNGDGSFQPEVDYPIGTAYTAPVALAADYLDGNGSLDLAVANAATSNVSVLLGNGDGSFQPSVEYPTSFGPSAVTTGDIDGDGKVDLLVTGNNGVSILRGNGDGTFKPFVGYATRGGTIVAGHFISNSRLDFATATQYNSNVFSFFVNSSAVALAPSRLAFGVQAGTNGNQRLVTVFNPGIVPLNIQNIVASGEFAQTNNCPSALAAGANCRITAKFVPTNSGLQQGTITITDDSPSSPHVIPLQGDAAAISMSPPFLSFGIVRIGHSASRTVTLMNLSNFAVPFYGVTIRGTRLSGGFSQTNNCGNSIPASGHCQLTITFAPMNASLEIAGATIFDRDIVPRQTIALRGIGHR